MENDDLEKMLQWKNGIGYLKGKILICTHVILDSAKQLIFRIKSNKNPPAYGILNEITVSFLNSVSKNSRAA